jgi:hypothetical protein
MMEVSGEDVLEVDGEPDASFVVFPIQGFLIQLRVLFRKQLLRESLEGDHPHPVLVEIAEDEVELNLSRVDLVLQHELRKVIGDQIALPELVETLEDGLHLEIGVVGDLLPDLLAHDLEAVPSQQVLGETATDRSHSTNKK